MADSSAATAHHGPRPDDVTKRDLLQLVADAGAAIGAGAIAWPLIDCMNPAKDVLALSSVEVDLTPIVEGQGITVVWHGKPIFVRHRTADEIKEAAGRRRSAQLIEPQTDSARVKAGHDQWIVLIGICTHLGCVPLGNKPTDPRGEWGGWFCPCHGSQYDTSGRVRHGPAPLNLCAAALRVRIRHQDQDRLSDQPSDPRQGNHHGRPAQERLRQPGDQLDRHPPAHLHDDAEGIRRLPDAEELQLLLEFRRAGDGQPGDHDRHRHLPGDELPAEHRHSPSTASSASCAT